MIRLILVHGLIAGAIVVAGIFLTMAAGVEGGVLGMALGYLSMLAALTMVYLGVRRYRDQHLGGVIRFPIALLVGFGISLVASVCYALAWEAYLWATDYRFMGEMIRSTIAAKRAAGASPAQIAQVTGEMQDFAKTYANPAMRLLITMSEIAPVGLLATLVSATVLRRRDQRASRAA